MVWTMNALEKVIEDMPVKVKKIHSDNGSEFINSYVKRFCERWIQNLEGADLIRRMMRHM